MIVVLVLLVSSASRKRKRRMDIWVILSSSTGRVEVGVGGVLSVTVRGVGRRDWEVVGVAHDIRLRAALPSPLHSVSGCGSVG